MIPTLFPAGDRIFQDDNALIYAACLVQSWFDEHEDEVIYLPVAQIQYKGTIMVYFRAFNMESWYPLHRHLFQNFHNIFMKNSFSAPA
ncbi:hypothetical protein TNCV_2307201 [Trichonephila clavipes]|nr:hypothetical protein TNCV_2307201 [Trichonephila clavipes]